MWLEPWCALLSVLDEHGPLDWQETFLDGSFAPTKKGAPQSVTPSAAREGGNRNGHAVATNKET